VAAREWVENADPTKRVVGETIAGSRAPNGAAARLQTAKATRAEFDAKLAEIEYQRVTGELVPLREMQEAVGEVARRVRDRLLTLPARLAPVVAGMAGSQEECYRAIETEVNETLDELAQMSVGVQS
jgi:hypothetical protein